MSRLDELAQRASGGERLDEADARELAALAGSDPKTVLAAAAAKRDGSTGPVVTFSKKVFIPLTKLCRDSCAYCTFAHPPRPGERAYLTIDEVLAIARAGRDAGCAEALFTLGDKPERKWREARAELDALGHETTVSYLVEACGAVLEETGLLPHANPGALTLDEALALRAVTVSQGTMLETLSERLLGRGMAHFGAPDKKPAVRLATLDAAGRARVPFTTGILVGIGETAAERVDALLAIRASHERHGHVQEVIVQSFRAKPGTGMARHPEPSLGTMLLTAALARLLLPSDVVVQAPPNLTGEYGAYLDAGVADWGGVSPVTPDHVNPERPWPHLGAIERTTAARGFLLAERLAVYPRYCGEPAALARWVDPALHARVLDAIDGEGLRRYGQWCSGGDAPPPAEDAAAVEAAAVGVWRVPGRVSRPRLARALDRAGAGEELSEDEVALLFTARGAEAERLYAVADELRAATVGDTVTYVVNRNINYTNTCYYRCGFCAFSKGPASLNLRGAPYLLSPEEVARRALEAWERGATEVCMQGGIHGSFTGDDYVAYLRAVKDAVPEMHVHGFTALEVHQGAATLGVDVRDFLVRLRDGGLRTLPGTAAEVLDDEIRALICPDKIDTATWCEVHRLAHSVGLRSNATIMFGTVEGPRHWARHLQVVRDLHDDLVAGGSEGLFEFVPLPFVHMAAPIYLKGRARRGPTFAEALKMHAVARIALHGRIPNIQVSWVKMGVEGSRLALRTGANDLGGTLMNENISRAAGAAHGQELTASEMERLIRSVGRQPLRRTTLYEPAPPASAGDAVPSPPGASDSGAVKTA
ncbi:MAG TPA: 5-amino-6-(D-ribitylamino)uracil--L-tyrosine 4-hydroxyphenyl transferase CofH [Actinomycetota bacterium]|nr:5-amino-6-(D-ribitylamino)uracil--L-tyrosine 4-hydroxyphenyl transferase CofH [Actinomycetota bacterium]